MSAHTPASAPAPAPSAPEPWWRFGHMWLVVGGPLAVVLASFVTIYLAITRPDPVYTGQYGSAQPVPAMQSRNHAATGGMAGGAPAASTPAPANQ